MVEFNPFDVVWDGEYIKVAYKVINKYFENLKVLYEYEDLVQEAAVVFVEVQNKYDSSKYQSSDSRCFYAFYVMSLQNHFKDLLTSLYGTEKNKIYLKTNINGDNTFVEEYTHDWTSRFDSVYYSIQLVERLEQAPELIKKALAIILGLEVEDVPQHSFKNDVVPSDSVIAKSLGLKRMTPVYPFQDEIKKLIMM